MTLAAVDRLVHCEMIFEINVESYKRHAAINRKHRPGRPAHYATRQNTSVASSNDMQTKTSATDRPLHT